MSPDETIGAWMKRRRKALDLTQKDLADRVGCSTATIHKIEREERRPSRQVAELIARALEIPIEQQKDFIKVARGEHRTETLSSLPASISRLPRVSRIPVPPTPIIGREGELLEIEHLLCEVNCRLLSIVGEGGIGKSRLALEIARQFEAEEASCEVSQFRDGIFFIPLVSLGSAELIITAIADAISFTFYDRADHQQQLIDHLQDKRLLLVLDNFDHLVQGAGILAELLAAIPGIQMLVTSRERLNLLGEWVFVLECLPYPHLSEDQSQFLLDHNMRTQLENYSAVVMFTQCARRRDASFRLTEENQLAVLKICQLVNGIPLALELAASWINALSCEEIAREIQLDASFLAATTRDIPERHRSIRAVFDHSWELLTNDQRLVLRQLSVFRGSFTRQAAEIVANARLETLVSLLEKSLLHRTYTGHFELHDLIRQFTARKLELNRQDFDQIHARHSSYYLDLLTLREPDLRSRRKKAALDELSSQIDDIRLAWDWATSQHQLYDLVKSAGGLLYYYDSRNLLLEGHKMFSMALQEVSSLQYDSIVEHEGQKEIDPDIYEVALAQMLSGSAYFDIRMSRIHDGIAKLQECIPLLIKHHEEALLADAYWRLATGFTSEGNYQEATRAVRESIVLNRRLGRQWQEAMALLTLGLVMTHLGNHMGAHRQLEEVLRMSRELEDTRLIILAISTLCQVKLRIGLPEEAIALLEEGYQIAMSAGDHYGITLILSSMANAAQSVEDFQPAKDLYQKSIERYRSIGDV